MTTKNGYVFSMCEDNHIREAERKIKVLQDKVAALQLLKELNKFGVRCTLILKGRTITMKHDKPICSRDAKGNEYAYIEAGADYVRTSWADVLLGFDMLMDDLKRKTMYVKEEGE